MTTTRVRLTAADAVDLGWGLVLPAGTHDAVREVSGGPLINSNAKMERYFIPRIGNEANIDVTKFVRSGDLELSE